MAEASEAPVVLYIEDSYQTRKVVTEELRARGYVVEAVGTAAKGMEALGRLEPDAILSDYLMPGMTGIEFFTELRKNEKFVNIPVVFLTSHIERNAMLRALQMGAEMYLHERTDPGARRRRPQSPQGSFADAADFDRDGRQPARIFSGRPAAND